MKQMAPLLWTVQSLMIAESLLGLRVLAVSLRGGQGAASNCLGRVQHPL